MIRCGTPSSRISKSAWVRPARAAPCGRARSRPPRPPSSTCERRAGRGFLRPRDGHREPARHTASDHAAKQPGLHVCLHGPVPRNGAGNAWPSLLDAGLKPCPTAVGCTPARGLSTPAPGTSAPHSSTQHFGTRHFIVRSKNVIQRPPHHPYPCQRAHQPVRPRHAGAGRAEIPAGQHGRRAGRHPAVHRRTRSPHRRGRSRRHAARAPARARRLPQGHRRRRRSGHCGLARRAARMGVVAMGRARRGVPESRGPGRHDVALDAQRRDDAGAEQDGVSGRDRRGVRGHRLLALQPVPTRRRSTKSSRSRARGCGTSSTTAGSKASSTRSRRSTSPPSAPTSPPRRR